MKFNVGLLTAMTFAVAFSTNAMATETGAGCGVGKVVMEGKSGKDANIVASAIDLFIPLQAFGMTSGTLGCDVSQQVSNEHERETFFVKNEDNLTIEMAQGEGSHLQSFASIMGVDNKDRDLFFDTLQTNYEMIVTSDNVLASIDTTLMVHPTLNKYVQ